MVDYLKALLLSESKQLHVDDSEILYVIDTNYLLYSIQTSVREHYYIEALNKHISHLYIPFSVYIEFLNDYRKIISETEKFLSTSSKMIKSLNELNQLEFNKDWLTELLTTQLTEQMKTSPSNGGISRNSFNTYSQHKSYDKDVFPKIQKILEQISEKLSVSLSNLNTDFQNEIENIELSTTDFDVTLYQSKMQEHLNALSNIFNHEGVLGKEYSQEKIDNWEQTISERVTDQSLPGYKDNGKDNQESPYRIFGSLKLRKSYGDALLWIELMDFVKNKGIEQVVFVSDDNKSDWVNPETKTMKQELVVDFLQKTGAYVKKISSETFISSSTSISDSDRQLIKIETENVNDDSNNLVSDSEPDCIIVPARTYGFENVFMDKNEWYSIKISNSRLKHLKYIAVYRTHPYSEITHFAKIKKIVPSDEDPTKKRIIFDGNPQPLEQTIPLGVNLSAMQSSRYTHFKKLFEAKNVDELFSEF
ncbi:PIN-like domain-containing protein [Leuconostoc mesenteroides]|uniref:PIN-like domain-containing protein n=1 Tax=Leuconostoc mesenteroides TaxID=1245 RepID=UPI0025A2E8D4|nr:PIN-like domain-containing protein [Leuconostoc mesenteroides]MDM7540007.1 PIN-like domain-containing protein [Leuconostoc mesenteroides]